MLRLINSPGQRKVDSGLKILIKPIKLWQVASHNYIVLGLLQKILFAYLSVRVRPGHIVLLQFAGGLGHQGAPVPLSADLHLGLLTVSVVLLHVFEADDGFTNWNDQKVLLAFFICRTGLPLAQLDELEQQLQTTVKFLLTS